MFSEEAMNQQIPAARGSYRITDIMLRADKLKKGAPELAKITKEMKKEANMSAVKADTLEQFARLEYALRDFVTEKGLAAMAFNAGMPFRKCTAYRRVMCWED